MPDENLSSQVQKEQETVTAPSSDNSKKWIKVALFGIVGIVITVGLVYAGYWYGIRSAKLPPEADRFLVDKTRIQKTPPPEPTPSPVTDPTANWKTYTNKAFNYSVKYLSDWTVTEENTGQGELARQSFRTAELDFSSTATELILAVVTEKPDSERLKSIGVIGEGVTSTFGNVSGTLYESEGTGIAGSGFRMDFIFEKGSQVYWIYLSTGLQNKMLYKPTFEQILSTFKFLD